MSDSERDQFLHEAIEALRQEVPESLEWLFADDPPALRWRSDGAPADPRLARGWLVLANRRDEVEPTDRQRQQASLIHCQDAAALARWLLKAWIALDTAPTATEPTDARRRELRKIAELAAEVARRFHRAGTDPEARYRQLVEQEGRSEASSALSHRGLLALVVVCADPADRALRSEIEGYLDI